MSEGLAPHEGNELDLDALRAQRLQNSPARRRARARSGGSGEVVTGQFAHLIGRAFAVRESDEYGYMLMDKMIEQTLAPYADNPAVARALTLGAAPLRRDAEGEEARAALGAQVLYRGTGRRKLLGVRFRIDKVVFQYGLTSGARTGLAGDNDWVDSLAAWVEEWRPEELITGPMARLARTVPLFGRLQAPLASSRTLVRTAEVPTGMDLTTDTGRAQWNALAQAAENDYRATVTRLLTGVVFELKNNRYPHAPLGLPPGYVKPGGRKENKHVVVPSTDPATLTRVRRFIELSASDATELEIAEELGSMGMTARSTAANPGGNLRPVDKVDDPVKLVRGLFHALPVYLDGRYLFRHEMPLPDLDTFHGYPVHRVDPRDHGYIEQELNFGLPPGGWHDPELITAAIRKRLTPDAARKPATTRDRGKPLAGLIRFVDGDAEYILLANEKATYELRRRPVRERYASPSGRIAPFRGEHGELVGRFKSSELHAAVARLLRQLEDGVPSSLRCPDQPAPDADQLQRLDAEAAEVRARLDNVRREIIKHSDADAEAYRGLEAEAKAALAGLEREIALLRSAAHSLPSQTPDLPRVAALVHVLEHTDGPTDLSVARALRGMIRAAAIHGAELTEPTATLQATLDLRTDQGVITLGPVSTLIRNRAVEGRPGADRRREGFARRNLRLMDMLLLESVPEEERRDVWEAEKLTPRSYLRRMTETLVPLVGSAVASAIIDCPILDTRRLVLQPHTGHDLPISPEFSPALRAHITGTYHGVGFTWTKGWCPGGMARER